MKKGKIRKVLQVIFLTGFLTGLAMLSYPLVSNVVNNHINNQLYNAYMQEMQKETDKEDLSKEWEKAQTYNASLTPIILPDSFVQATNPYTDDIPYTEALNLNGDGLIGFVEIPKIDIRLPIYHSTDETVLEKGTGHLHGSSLPCGGMNTHAVVAAHRGLPDASLFTDLDQLKKGDQFYIYVLDQTLAYEVDQVKVVEQTETDDLQVEDGKDLVTLLTCTPYGVNTQRLLVRGHRIPYSEEAKEEQGRHVVHSLNTNYVLLVAGGIAIAVFVMLIVALIMKKTGKRKHEKETV